MALGAETVQRVATAFDSVDGLLPDDLAVFVEVLSRHGRHETLQSDIEFLVDEHFTAELLASYDQHWGDSLDFSPKSLVRLARAELTPTMAGQALKRGQLTVNDAITDVAAFVHQCANADVDERTARRLYQIAGNAPSLGSRFTAGDLDLLRSRIDTCEQAGITAADLEALSEVLGGVTPEVVHTFALSLLNDPPGFTFEEVLAASASDAADLEYALTRGKAGLLERLTPEVLTAGRDAGLPLERILAVVRNPRMLDQCFVSIFQVAALLPADTPPHYLRDLGVLTSGRGAFDSGAVVINSLHPVEFPDPHEAVRRYQNLPDVPHEERLEVIPHVPTPTALAVYLHVRQANSGTPGGHSPTHAARLASQLADYPHEQAFAYLRAVEELLGSLDAEPLRSPTSDTWDKRTLSINDVLTFVIERGPEQALADAADVKEAVCYPHLHGAKYVALAHKLGVDAPALVSFLHALPQVDLRHVPTLVAEDVDPALFGEIMRALPFADFATHAGIYAAISRLDVPLQESAERVRRASDGNPSADPTGLVLAASGHQTFQDHNWDGISVATALTDLDSGIAYVTPPPWAATVGACSSFGPIGGLEIPHFPDTGVTYKQAVERPWSIRTSSGVSALESTAVYEAQDFLFPQQGLPGQGPNDLLAARALRRVLDKYRQYRIDEMDGQHSHTPDARWGPARAAMLEHELGREEPYFQAVAYLIYPEFATYSSAVRSPEDAALLAALVERYPALAPGMLASVFAVLHGFNDRDNPERVRVLQGVHDRIIVGRAVIGAAESAKPLAPNYRLTAEYVHQFADTYPDAGLGLALVNFFAGHPADKMPRAVAKLDKYTEDVHNVLLDGRIYEVDDSGHPAERTGRHVWPISLDYSPKQIEATTKHSESHAETVGLPPYVFPEVLDVRRPRGYPPANRSVAHGNTSRRPVLSAAQADSVAAHCERISKVVDWYAHILVDPLWTSEHAPAILDRRSELMADVESVLVQLQDHPLMQGTVDPAHLSEIGQQPAPVDFAQLTGELERTMHVAWETARSSGQSYPTRDLEQTPQQIADTLDAQADVASLRAKAAKLRLSDPATPDGAGKHAKAAELDAEADRLHHALVEQQRDTAAIERLIRGLGSSGVLRTYMSLNAFPHAAALAAKERPAITGADGQSAGARVTVQVRPRARDVAGQHL